MIDLKEFRKQHGLKQEDVSKLSGIDRARISKYESRKDISPTVEIAILQAYPSAKEFIIEGISGHPTDFDQVLYENIELKKRLQNREADTEFLKVQLDKLTTMLNFCMEKLKNNSVKTSSDSY